jgi:hypothetical protein
MIAIVKILALISLPTSAKFNAFSKLITHRIDMFPLILKSFLFI